MSNKVKKIQNCSKVAQKVSDEANVAQNGLKRVSKVIKKNFKTSEENLKIISKVFRKISKVLKLNSKLLKKISKCLNSTSKNPQRYQNLVYILL
jgi:hypothetical protein